MDNAQLLSQYCYWNKIKPPLGFSVQKQIFDTASMDAENPQTLEELIEELTPRNTKPFPFPLAFFIANELLTRAEQNEIDLNTARILDPEIGSGKLLYALITLLQKKTKQPIDQILNRITGLSINPTNVQNFTYIMELMLLHKKTKTTESIHLHVTDPFTYSHSEPYEIILSAIPPTLRLPHKTQEHLNSSNPNKADSTPLTNEPYLWYFNLIPKHSSPYGVASITITQNDYTLEETPPAALLRKWLIEEELIDHILKIKLPIKSKQPKFITVSFLTHRPSPTMNDKIRIHTIDSVEEIETLPRNWGNSPDMQVSIPKNIELPWNPSVDPTVQKAISIITKQPLMLKDYIQIHPNINTGRDSLYTLSGKQDKNGNYIKRFKNKTFLVEEELTVPLVRPTLNSDENTLENMKTRILYPYATHEEYSHLPTILPEEYLQETYPNAYSYLKEVQLLLEKRPSRHCNLESTQWYAYSNSPPSPVLPVPSPVLYVATKFISSPVFMKVNRKPVLALNGLILEVVNEDWDIIQAVLNSSVFARYLQYTLTPNSRGMYELTESSFEGFTFPEFTDLQRKGLRVTDGADRDKIIVLSY